MPFRTITTTPEELSILSKAFDEAWIAIEKSRPVAAEAQPAARERLAYVIIGLWRAGTDDLVGTAVRHFMQDEPAASPRPSDAAHPREPTKA